ncbi:hypothetical protein QF028_000033 [Neobacillus sp. B4I6]|uniref:hypothetical protein n=1 Tax=Neobacillus sp. B4I6 TaxID=3373925 RepID=UPI003D1F1A0B
MPVNPNPLTQLTTYIPMASALLGATVGGIVAWFNLNRTFNEQRRREQLQESKNERIAINSVMKEVDYNSLQLLNLKKKMKKFTMDEVDFKTHPIPLVIKQDKWVKHSDNIEFIEKFDISEKKDDNDFSWEAQSLLLKLEYFYYQINSIITSQYISIQTAEDLIPIGQDISSQLGKALKEYKTK